jgi:protein phosphatase
MSGTTEVDTDKFAPQPLPGTERPQSLSALVQVEVGARSDPGKVRTNNEDHYLVARYSRSMVTLKTNVPAPEIFDPFEEVGHAFVVADGMGGTAAGEVASSLAITTAVNLSLKNPHWTLTITEEQAKHFMRVLEERFQEINHVLVRRARADPALSGMGTTLTGAYSVGAELFLCHVGDSRAYLLRQGKLHQLTQDHTLAQAMADAGQIAPEEVSTHRLRHVLTHALGGQTGQVKTQIQNLRLEDGDQLLLCTDGLYEMVADAAIARALETTSGADEACDALVALALEGGGKDNVTVVLARYTVPASARA